MSTPTLPMPGRTGVAVVGGGIAGLVAAVEAAEHATGPVTLVDGGPGRARTVERDGVRLNDGPHALYLDGALARALRAWGIEHKARLEAASAASQKPKIARKRAA